MNRDFKDFHFRKKSEYKEGFDISFKLANNIRNHLKKEESKSIYLMPNRHTEHRNVDNVQLSRI